MKLPAYKSGTSTGQFAWLIIALVLLYLPLRIIGFGFLPPDDALRYAAKAVSGKTWHEIVLMRPEIQMDHNAGWDWILTSLYHLTHWSAPTLVFFSVVLMFALFAAAPLPFLKRPEAWLGALVIVFLAFPYFALRVQLGRPLMLTMAITIFLLGLWTRPIENIRTTWLWSTALIALAAWVHGSFYLMAFLPLVFVLSREWRKGLLLAASWGLGSIIGACFTGHPWEFLYESVLIPIIALGQNAPQDSLVAEFQPFDGGWPALIIVGLVLIWRKLTGRSVLAIWRDPVFWLALLGWFMGIRIVRFWLDWGLPALAFWLARQFDDLFQSRIAVDGWQRIAVSALFSFLLLSGVATDKDARWSQYANWECLDSRRPEHQEWLPGPGGILYNVNLSVFYYTFFTNPHGDWKYALGFEPSFMRPDDYEVYKNLWRTKNAVEATKPWVAQMRPEDRLVLLGGPEPKPTIPQLEWYYAAQDTWVGRLPRPKQGPLHLSLPK